MVPHVLSTLCILNCVVNLCLYLVLVNVLTSKPSEPPLRHALGLVLSCIKQLVTPCRVLVVDLLPWAVLQWPWALVTVPGLGCPSRQTVSSCVAIVLTWCLALVAELKFSAVSVRVPRERRLSFLLSFRRVIVRTRALKSAVMESG